MASHWLSWGQTRPHTAGRALSLAMIWYAPSKSPSATLAINSGMWIFTGHPATQGIFLQLRHRAASSMACSRV